MDTGRGIWYTYVLGLALRCFDDTGSAQAECAGRFEGIII